MKSIGWMAATAASFALSACGGDREPEPVATVQPLPKAAERNAAAEEKFLKEFRAALAAKDKAAILALGHWEGAPAPYTDAIAAAIDNMIGFPGPVVSLEVDASTALPTTIPYLGRVRVTQTYEDGGKETAAIPFGIKEGKCGLTVLSR